jgi:hypothetical protein
MHLVDSLIPGAIPVYISRFSLELFPNMHEKKWPKWSENALLAGFELAIKG